MGRKEKKKKIDNKAKFAKENMKLNVFEITRCTTFGRNLKLLYATCFGIRLFVSFFIYSNHDIHEVQEAE